ncbi:MAG: hypothetical protein A2912_03775 [Candidatus Buchananbacteria bacterium RIFCSPLOWO2_01_FULL_40_23b]|uniref:Uncharacterized protein n=1 Tax=Candidatus Buchananbacteria bacterium RIFCSPLOWO2_01_FULL_40_23b TaxID=1797544 RepID=A0A1G1YMP7_9BACT|nr:MAG: hypothetical protein A2912_03775 [Candidatus Buchananbacteria bacterium RIFCSPLOWO2_01_FULL_40_23b]
MEQAYIRALGGRLERGGFYTLGEQICSLRRLEYGLHELGRAGEGHVNVVAAVMSECADTKRIVAYTTQIAYANMFLRGLDDGGERRQIYDSVERVMEEEGFSRRQKFVFISGAALENVLGNLTGLLQRGLREQDRLMDYMVNVMWTYGVGGYVVEVASRAQMSEVGRFAANVRKLEEIV